MVKSVLLNSSFVLIVCGVNHFNEAKKWLITNFKKALDVSIFFYWSFVRRDLVIKFVLFCSINALIKSKINKSDIFEDRSAQGCTSIFMVKMTVQIVIIFKFSWYYYTSLEF